MPNKYCDYFDINERYFTCVDESAINNDLMGLATISFVTNHHY